jgi:hypothetical protein
MAERQWAAVYNATTGALHSLGELTAAEVAALPAPLVAAVLPGRPEGVIWDTATRAFVAEPARTRLTRMEFIERFTADEYEAIAASENKNVRFFMEKLRLAEEILCIS